MMNQRPPFCINVIDRVKTIANVSWSRELLWCIKASLDLHAPLALVQKSVGRCTSCKRFAKQGDKWQRRGLAVTEPCDETHLMKTKGASDQDDEQHFPKSKNQVTQPARVRNLRHSSSALVACRRHSFHCSLNCLHAVQKGTLSAYHCIGTSLTSSHNQFLFKPPR